MEIGSRNPEPIQQIRYRYAQRGGGTGIGVLGITRAPVAGLSVQLEGIILTADLQGRELIPPKKSVTAPHRLVGREGPRLLGEIAAGELERLAEQGQLPRPDQTGVLLAGDFWTEPGSQKRGSAAGDVGPVWREFRRHFRWVVGVLGNHDTFAECQEEQSERAADVHLLDGHIAVVDGLRIGGVSGIMGNSSRPNRKTEEMFLERLNRVLNDRPDLVVLHQGPDMPESGSRGEARIRECLQSHRPTVVVCGHCYWKVPFQRLSNGTQVCNVDSRVIVLTR